MQRFKDLHPIHTDITVAWADMDALQHVNNVVYLRYFEIARIDFLNKINQFDTIKPGGIGPVISENNILALENDEVTFQYKPSKSKTFKTITEHACKFLWRIIQHVLPKGFRRARNYGFLHGNAKCLRVRIQTILLHLFNWKMPLLTAKIPSKAIRIFPCCQHEMKCVGITRTT